MSSPTELTCQQLVELVSDYLDDQLETVQRERFLAHLALCDPCHEYVEQMRETVAALGRLEPEHLSRTARDELLHAFRTWHTTTT